MAIRRKTIKREVGQALHKVMEPDDRIVAGTWAAAGPGPWLDILAIAGFFVLEMAALRMGASPGPLWEMTGPAIPMATYFWRRPVFVAVTERQLICYRLARITNDPLGPRFCAPVPTVRMTALSGRLAPWWSIRYDGPGAERRGLRLNLPPTWRRDTGDVLDALYQRGAYVAGKH